jgi:hypothetical protein
MLNTSMPGISHTFVDPTGTYILKGEVKKNRIIGHYGELRVRLLDPGTAVFCLYVNNGYPKYASFALMDTLKYEENRMRYRITKDSSCSLILLFNVNGVELVEVFANLENLDCCASDVLIPAVFDKKSSETPIIQDLSRQMGEE